MSRQLLTIDSNLSKISTEFQKNKEKIQPAAFDSKIY